jgi:hypothetical protein
VRLAIRPGEATADVREPTAKSVEVRFTAPNEAALELIRNFFAR